MGARPRLSRGWARLVESPARVVVVGFAVAALLGTLFGSLPGIGPINGIAILMPLAYTLGLPAESALILLAGILTLAAPWLMQVPGMHGLLSALGCRSLPG